MIEILSWLNVTAILLLYQFDYVVYDTENNTLSSYTEAPNQLWFPRAGRVYSDNVIAGVISAGPTIYAVRANAQGDSYPSYISGYMDLENDMFFMRRNSGYSLTETIDVIDVSAYSFLRGVFTDPNVELHLSDTLFVIDDVCLDGIGQSVGVISHDKICTHCTMDLEDDINSPLPIQFNCTNKFVLSNNDTLELQDDELVIYDSDNTTLASIGPTNLFCLDRFNYSNMSISNYTYQPYFRAFTWTDNGRIGIMYYESCLITWLSANVLEYFGIRPVFWNNNTVPNIGTYNGTHFQLFNRTEDFTFNATYECTDLVYTSRPDQICIRETDTNTTCNSYEFVNVGHTCSPFQKCSTSYHMHPTTTNDVECIEGIVRGHSTPFDDFEIEAVYNNRDRQGLVMNDPACGGLIGEYVDDKLQGCIEQSSSCLFGIGPFNECLPAEKPAQSVCIVNAISTSAIEVGRWRDCKIIKTYIAKMGTTAIGGFALYNSSVETVLIENSVTYIGLACFAHSNLYKLEIQTGPIFLPEYELEFGLPVHEGLFSYSSLNQIIGLEKILGLDCYDFIETDLTTLDYILNGFKNMEVNRCAHTPVHNLKIVDSENFVWMYPTPQSDSYNNESVLELDNSVAPILLVDTTNTSLNYLKLKNIKLTSSRLLFVPYFTPTYNVIIEAIITDFYSLSWLLKSSRQYNIVLEFGTILLTDVILNNQPGENATNLTLNNLTADKLVLQSNVVIGDNVFQNLSVRQLDISSCAIVSPTAFIGANCNYKAGYQYNNCVKTVSSDTTCVPCPSNYYRKDDKCVECTSGCGPGHFFETPCTTHLDIVCTPCEQGTYQDRTNHKIVTCAKQSDGVFSTMFTMIEKDKRLYKIIATCLLSVPLLYNIITSGVRKFWMRKTKV